MATTASLGDAVFTKLGNGRVRFLGETSFSGGVWCGVELETPTGKNDGSVAGVRYFECTANHGLFCRPSQVRVIEAATRRPANASRPSMASRTGTSTPSRPPSAAGRAPGTAGVGTRSIMSPPRSQMTSPTPRPIGSLATPGMTRTKSGSSSPTMSRAPSTTAAAPPSIRRRPTAQADPVSPALPSPALLEPLPISEEPVASTSTNDPYSLKSRTAEVVPARDQTVPLRMYEEAVRKLRILEAHRQTDRDRLRELDKVKEEAEVWASQRPKLQAKMIEMQTELKTLRQRSKDLEVERDAADARYNDLADQVELATLDKEVAEEKYDALEATAEALRERIAELEVAATVATERDTAAGGAVSGEDSLAQLQLAKQNERLKDALMKLRDLYSESEQESRRRIADLEKELDLTVEMQASYETIGRRAEQAEALAEDLRSQLDDALGAEDMLEQLTERNLTLSEKVEELTATVADLEALKELNDELEETHVETEKQLLEEIDLKDTQMRDLKRRGDTFEESLADYEVTIGQFRELVLSLQGDLEQMRAQRETQQSESQQLTSQSQAMLNLNLKLQTTVQKAQVKTIDFELRRLESVQAIERLSIVRPYLPPAFFESDGAAVDALLFFERLAAKGDLISSVLAQRNNVADALNSAVPESLMAVCDTRARLSRFGTLCRRFAANLRRCAPETFINMGSVYLELFAFEKRIDGHVTALRTEELREVDCGKDLDRFIAQAAHIAERSFGESDADIPEQQIGVAHGLDLDLDTFLAGIGFTKQTIAVLSKESGLPLEPEDADLDVAIFLPLQQLIDQARSAQTIVRKMLRRHTELSASTSAIAPSSIDAVADVARSIQKLAATATKLGGLAQGYATDLRLHKGPLQLATLLGIAQEAASDLSLKSTNTLAALDTDITMAVSRLSAVLPIIMAPEQVIKASYSPPWIERVNELTAAAAASVDAERKALKLNEELRDLRRDLRTRDQSLQESSVKIELMEKRVEAVKKQADAIADLEGELAKAKKQERTYEEAIEALQADLDTMEADLVKAKSAPTALESDGDANNGPTAPTSELDSLIFSGSLETAQLVSQIESLRGAVRFFRRENGFLKSRGLLEDLAPLPHVRETSSLSAAEQDERRALAEERKAVIRAVVRLASAPKVVDLSLYKPGPGWQRAARRPENQYAAQQDAMRKLLSRVEGLKSRGGFHPSLPTVVRV